MDLAGLGLTRSYALLDPQRSVTPRGGRTFSLDRDATVEAIVNGRMVRTMRLQPGTYNVSDFPFAQGGNDVELVITDDTGRRDVISFTMFIERSEEHTSELQSLMRISYAVFCLKKKKTNIYTYPAPNTTATRQKAEDPYPLTLHSRQIKLRL